MRRREITAADLFCGAGGTSEGLARACARTGKKLDLVAVNHWKLAIETHRKNHPEARHVCAALEGLNPRDLVPSGRLNILVASPECTNHSVARGGRPINDQSRASAWLILKWLQELYVESILIENVAEFQQWGPLGVDGRPLKSKKGELFRRFIETLRSLGYAVEWRVLNAANYGDPTTRQRLFILGRRGRNAKITWPAWSHAREPFAELKPWRPAREIIDWSLPGTSIFNRKKPLAMNTLKRTLAGMHKFNWPEPFIVVLRNHMDARSLDQPLPTVTAGGHHLGLCEPFVLQQQSGGSPRSIESPVPTVATCGAISLVMANRNNNVPRSVDEPVPTLCTGNHIYKIDPFAVPFFGERRGQAARVHSLDEPLPAVTSHGAGGIVAARVQPLIIEMRNGKTARSLDEPLSTVTTLGAHHALAQPFIDKYYGSGVAANVEDPLDTVTAKARFGLCQVGDTVYDVLFRMLRPRELARAQGFPERYQFPSESGAATKLIGNAVPTNLAEALCAELIA